MRKRVYIYTVYILVDSVKENACGMRLPSVLLLPQRRKQ